MHMDVHSSRSPVLTGPLPLPLCATQHRSHMQLAAAIPLKRSAYWQSGVLPWEAVRHICVSLPLPTRANANTLFFSRNVPGFYFWIVSRIPSPAKLSISRVQEKKLKHKKRKKKDACLLLKIHDLTPLQVIKQI